METRACAMAEEAGAKVTTSVSSNTDYVVAQPELVRMYDVSCRKFSC